jgi:hypothetical protein
MMAITIKKVVTESFTRPVARHIHEDLNEAIAHIARKYGIELSSGNLRFSSGEFKCSIKGATLGRASEQKSNADKSSFDDYVMLQAHFKGLPDIGSTFKVPGGHEYEILGGKFSRRKYPIDIKDLTSERAMRCTASWVISNCK